MSEEKTGDFLEQLVYRPPEASQAARQHAATLPTQPAAGQGIEEPADRFINPKTGKPYTTRDGEAFDPDKHATLPDGSPDVTVDGYLRKTKSGKNKNLIQKAGEKIKSVITHPAPDSEEWKLRETEKAEKEALKKRQELEKTLIQHEAMRDLIRSKNARTAVSEFRRLVYGNELGLLDAKEAQYVEALFYDWEKQTGKEIPINPTHSLILGLVGVMHEPLVKDKEAAKKALSARWSWLSDAKKSLKEKAVLLFLRIKGAKNKKQAIPAVQPVREPDTFDIGEK